MKNLPAPILRFKEFSELWESKKGSDLFINSRIKGNDKLPLYSVTLEKGMIPRDSLDRYMANDAEAGDNLYVGKNDISYNMMRMWQGAFGLAPVDCMVSPAYVVLRPKTNVDSSFFIRYFNRSRSLYLFTAYSYGLTSDRLRLYFKDFSQIVFKIPSLPEQKKIACFLLSIDEKINQLKRKKELLEQYKKGVMQQLFSGKLRFKDENGKEYPEWEEKKLGDVTRIRSGLSMEQNETGKYKVTRIETISNGTINEEKIGLVESVAGFEDYKLKKGDILFSNINSVSHIGKSAIAERDFDLYHGMNLLCIKSYKILFPNYLFYHLNTEKIRNHFKSVCNQAISQASINQASLSKTIILMPSFNEQNKIANFLSSIDTKIVNVNMQINQTQTFKKGLLQQMFV